MPRKFTRLFVESDLLQEQRLQLNLKESHYVKHVLRLVAGDSLLVFNGRHGEWRAEVAEITKKQTHLDVKELVRPQKDDFPVFLLFASLKMGPLGFLVEKATELGATHLQPLWTDRTQGRDFRHERYLSIAREAAEQSERMSVPTLHTPLTLDVVLSEWKPERSLMVCDERGGAESLLNVLQKSVHPMMSCSVMVGPEGGFSPQEFNIMAQFPWLTFVSLGDNILRAETAAIAALSLFCTIPKGFRHVG